MVYKWCVVPHCANTSIKSPNKLFVSIPNNPTRRKVWLKLARRDPNSILSHTNVFMCEDHFDMEKDTKNYLKYKIGFSKNILLTDDAVPSKFNCQEDRKGRQSEAGPFREGCIKRERIDLVTQCLLSENASETSFESLPKDDNVIQLIAEPEVILLIKISEFFHNKTISVNMCKSVRINIYFFVSELSNTEDNETITDTIITVEKSVQVTTKLNIHYRSKAVQTRNPCKTISTSPFKATTISCFTSPFKFKRKSVIEDEKSDSDISYLESAQSSSVIVTSSSRVTG